MTFGPTPFSNTSSSGQVQTGYTYGETSDRLGLQAACGSVTLTLSAPPSKSGIEPTGQTQEQLVNVQNVTATVEKAHQTALPALQAAMDALAKQIVDPNSRMSAQQAAAAIDVGVNAYAQTIAAISKAAATQQVDADYINAMRADGWAYAGLYYVKIVKAQSDIAAAISAIPASQGMSSTSRAALSLFVDDIDVNLNKANDILADAARRDATGLAQNNADGGSGADRIIAWFATGKSVVDSTLSGGGQVNANPLLAVVELGHSMMWWGEGAFTAASSVSLLGVIPRVSNVMQLVYTIISGPFALMFSVLVGGGAMLAVYLPMIPTLMWYTAVFSWVVTLAEAVIAAPVWMCMHLHPAGEETGKAASGYSLILSLTVRPALMVLGLCMAIEILPLAGGFVMGTFAIAFHMSVTSGHFAGLFITLAGCVMFVTTMVLIIRKTFSLIHVIPDQILTWIGNGAGQLGSTIKEMDGTAHNKVAAAFSHTSKVAGAAGGGLGKALGPDSNGKGKDGSPKPDRDPGITV
ncbi:TPA: DotA/TraY family protein, partial [Burkholderia vietnamiensis]|nr:DotA/TraY family protein [Burkholderia vietnamiensis]